MFDPKTARPEEEIFADLAKLCILPGYVHALAYLCFRDNIILYVDEVRPEDMQRILSPKRLIRTEISTLIGLMIKAEIDYTIPSESTLQTHVEKTEALLEDLHNAMAAVWFKGFDPSKGEAAKFDPFGHGDALREPIFYGGESAYSFQYRDFAPIKYARDDAWLTANRGFSITIARDMVASLGKFLDIKLMATERTLHSVPPDRRTRLPGYIFSVEEVANCSGLDATIVRNILDAFTLQATERNQGFLALHDFNIANSLPLIRVDEKSFLLLQRYSLAEALYDTPFYWMTGDKEYVSQALRHRGEFTEDFARERLEHVFGKKHVYANVDIVESKSKRVGEIDVLVVFGNRAIVVQAKSKRLTLEARRGNDGQIKDDFKKAVQDAYDQGYLCATSLVSQKYKLVDSTSQQITVPNLKEVYILCVVSDHYPALAFQARQFLKYQSDDVVHPPFVMDVFTLDAMAEMLESPLRFLSYVARRTSYTGKLMAQHELTILSDHLARNLWLDDKYDMVFLNDDISADLDTAMTVRRDGLPGKRTPDGILTRLQTTSLGRIIREIETKAEPATIDLGFTLLSLSEDTLREASKGIDAIVAQARRDSRHHDITVGLKGGSSGLTIHCNDDPIIVAESRLRTHCSARKYSQRATSWFGLCLSSAGSLRFGLNLEYKWQQDSGVEAVVRQLRTSSKPVDFNRLPKPKRKTGRNDTCPCGSGLKYKRCHGR